MVEVCLSGAAEDPEQLVEMKIRLYQLDANMTGGRATGGSTRILPNSRGFSIERYLSGVREMRYDLYPLEKRSGEHTKPRNPLLDFIYEGSTCYASAHAAAVVITACFVNTNGCDYVRLHVSLYVMNGPLARAWWALRVGAIPAGEISPDYVARRVAGYIAALAVLASVV